MVRTNINEHILAQFYSKPNVWIYLQLQCEIQNACVIGSTKMVALDPSVSTRWVCHGITTHARIVNASRSHKFEKKIAKFQEPRIEWTSVTLNKMSNFLL